jgi:ADP-dependent NAD(P)H-hydrate dehydratase / NAD(P)H-hydrate epimerase
MALVPVVSAAEMRLIEADAVAKGATWQGLMATAGQKVAEAAIRWRGPDTEQRVLVIAGPGNNGGDGLVVARHLKEHGWAVRCITWGRVPGKDPHLLVPLRELDVPVEDLEHDDWRTALSESLAWCTVVVDAVFGTGLKRNIEGDLVAVLGLVAGAGKPVLAVDLPTGVDSDTGQVRGAALQADLTVTLGHYKYGHFLEPGRSLAAHVVLEDIGLDATTSRRTAKGELLTEELIRGLLPERRDDANKGTFGKAFIVAGSVNYIGAAALATEGAMRSGAGLVTLGCAGDLLVILAAKLTECTFLPLPADLGAIGAHATEKLLAGLKGYNSLLIGSGIGQDKATLQFIRNLFARPDVPANLGSRSIGFAARIPEEEAKQEANITLPPLVLDGDALNLLAEWGDWVGKIPEGGVMTPHPGEMARLLGTEVDEVQADRVAVATRAAADWKQVVVLKGAGTVIAEPGGRVFLSPFANPALATAGSGDVLAGAIAGLIAQGLSPVDAACAGVYLHGIAGELLREKYGVAGGLAGDLPRLLARAQKQTREGRAGGR